jgi:hypothetical protein
MEIFDWAQTLSALLPQAVIDSRGRNVKIALIDTGVDLDVHSLGHLDKPGRKFFVGKPGFSMLDHSGKDAVGDGFSSGGHGTPLACILAGKSDSMQEHLIDGIAHEADVIIIKARDHSGSITEIQHLLHAFELAVDLGVDIAVTAQTLSNRRIETEGIAPAEVERVMQKVRGSNLLLLASIENRSVGGDWSNVVSRKFPSSQDGVINVAAAPSDISSVRNQIINQKIHFMLGGIKGLVYDTNNNLFPIELSNSTAVTIMGGIAALILSNLKAHGPVAKNDLFAALSDKCLLLTEANGNYPEPVLFKKN